MTGTGMLQARLLVALGDHVHGRSGLSRLGSPTVAKAEVALGAASAQDVSPGAARNLQGAIEAWLSGGDPAPPVLSAFWDGRMDRVKLSPVGSFRLHVCAPVGYRLLDPTAFYMAPKSHHFERDGDMQSLRVSRSTVFPEDTVVWWEGREDVGQLVELVQPSSTLTIIRPRKSWWLPWAEISPVAMDRVAAAVYARFNLEKVFSGDDPDFELVVMGVGGARTIKS